MVPDKLGMSPLQPTSDYLRWKLKDTELVSCNLTYLHVYVLCLFIKKKTRNLDNNMTPKMLEYVLVKLSLTFSPTVQLYIYICICINRSIINTTQMYLSTCICNGFYTYSKHTKKTNGKSIANN